MKKYRVFFKQENISSIEVEAEGIAEAKEKANAITPKFLTSIPADIFDLIGVEEIK